jgi:hypothetical protein
MSKIELDDQILEHPKFLRLARTGGSPAIHMWLGLRAYCAQKLTDGKVPYYVMQDVRGPRDLRARTRALRALCDCNLLHERSDCWELHDYLDHASTRAQVLAWRAANAERKRLSREKSQRDGQCDSPCDGERDTKSGHAGSPSGVPAPSPSLISDLGSQSEEKRDPELRVSPATESKHRKPRTAKPKPPTEEDRPGRKEMIDHYFVVFDARRHSKPCFGSREGKAVNQLLDAVSGDLLRAKTILTNAYADPWWGDKVTILEIVKDPSKFVTAGLPSRANGSGPMRPGRDPRAGNGPQPDDINNPYPIRGL